MSLATISTAVISDTAPNMSLKADSVAWVNTVKLIINVEPEATNRQLIAFSILRWGLSFVTFFCFADAAI
jgi:hypothetical protein